jgi:hypothetical protein
LCYRSTFEVPSRVRAAVLNPQLLSQLPAEDAPRSNPFLSALTDNLSLKERKSDETREYSVQDALEGDKKSKHGPQPRPCGTGGHQSLVKRVFLSFFHTHARSTRHTATAPAAKRGISLSSARQRPGGGSGNEHSHRLDDGAVGNLRVLHHHNHAVPDHPPLVLVEALLHPLKVDNFAEATNARVFVDDGTCKTQKSRQYLITTKKSN